MQEIKKPSQFLHLTEIFRAIYENIKGLFYISKIPKSNFGRGKYVMVVPGLLSTDWYTTNMRKFLTKIGFYATGWGMGRNLGRLDSLKLLIERVENIQKERGEKIILIGWSMGGIFAREVAKAIPNSIEKVITVGSPFGDLHAPNHAKWVYDLLNHPDDVDQAFVDQVASPAPVPTVALYSKVDGMVPWQACREHKEDATHKNIEVVSSHFGMGGNVNVMKTIKENILS